MRPISGGIRRVKVRDRDAAGPLAGSRPLDAAADAGAVASDVASRVRAVR
jgi:hypothetical protein